MNKTIIKTLIIISIIIIILFFMSILIINWVVKGTTKNKILTLEEVKKLNNIDAIIILGCKVKENNIPSDMLKDRLETGIEVYNLNVTDKIIMSGDHGRTEYDEVNVMKDYAINKGIQSKNIFMDHAGFSTYETMYRAKKIFEAKNVIIITQEYHLYRSIYIAKKLGLNAYGVSADKQRYFGQTKRDLREILARYKDFFKTIIKPKPTYLGEVIPISGDGDITNDK